MAGTATVEGTFWTDNAFLDGLISASRWTSGTGTAVISVAFAAENQTLNWNWDGTAESIGAYVIEAPELAAMKAAMQVIAEVCDIDFRLGSGGAGVSVANADLIWASIDSADAGGSDVLGWARPPGAAVIGGSGYGVVAINWEAYSPADGRGLVRGGFDFCTFIHELGHALGLSHPHDDGFGSTKWPGVDNADDLGSNNLNQGIYTMMGYNDGWQTGPGGLSASQVYGWQAGPMAFDIAALQVMYGPNMAHNATATTYKLPDANRVGTFWSCIWDAGGTDAMVGAGSRANVIDLRAATLEDAPGGGGWVSHASGIYGGFTIAYGVVIENAKGGGLSDQIRGNGAANRLEGLGGGDTVWGGRGGDILLGGGGSDTLSGEGGTDRLTGGAGADTLSGGGGADRFVFLAAGDSTVAARDTVLDFLRGTDRIDLRAIDANGAGTGFGQFRLDTGGGFAVGEVRQIDTGADIRLEMNLGGDSAPEMAIVLRNVANPLAASDFVFV